VSTDHGEDADDESEQVEEEREGGGEAEEEIEDKEETGAEETFTTYVPKKLTIGKKHPGQIVETSVLGRGKEILSYREL